MRIVLSRKGFDSAYGKTPSPILPDGTPVPLPIPALGSPTRFDDVRWRDATLGPIVEALTHGRVRGSDRCHLDPDLRRGALPRAAAWRPAFGQVGAAAAHLANEGVGPGDVFVFFGSFRRTEREGLGYVAHEPAVHLIFGWLQVADVLNVGDETEQALRERPWLERHPHLEGRWDASNTIYVASEKLTISGNETGHAGGGMLSSASAATTLTAPGAAGRSDWRIPAWLAPGTGRRGLSYHRDAARWRVDGESADVRTVGRGQEFVIDTGNDTPAQQWLLSIVAGHSKPGKE